MPTWFFSKPDDPDGEIGISATRWYDAKFFALMLLGEGAIGTRNCDDTLQNDSAQAKYELKQVGSAAKRSDELYLMIRKRQNNGKWSTWRRL